MDRQQIQDMKDKYIELHDEKKKLKRINKELENLKGRDPEEIEKHQGHAFLSIEEHMDDGQKRAYLENQKSKIEAKIQQLKKQVTNDPKHVYRLDKYRELHDEEGILKSINRELEILEEHELDEAAGLKQNEHNMHYTSFSNEYHHIDDKDQKRVYLERQKLKSMEKIENLEKEVATYDWTEADVYHTT
mmetsp:Transcript_13626/g.16898  ORF Transcript_13626/g.16898 Transcript_13626/m.16898 type:complete len:189 (-) Transcript_13626:674-1240(-)|eukprot:CAMPEP_0204826912 /NCGR_PEP_ID=MMETSP1346-20131115/4509_1 /ASSEMBLY_ACC=CAM_ASM_000771 /TAXON_ID=215587 /ORGANISM="Aplanochytrium stocchinoi, Strain GSBS06" /LENGTH=188 /DNA_ID=CAMNT_0051955147 /DNA_START=307 /DNA_END=873 /DNA_ORIENTATION=+